MVDLSKKSRLLEKRARMKMEIERKARLELIADLVDLFDRKDVVYEIDWSDTCRDWLYAKLPFKSWGQIDWQLLENKKLFNDVDVQEVRSLLCSMIDKERLSPEESVTVMWSNINRPSLKLSFGDLMDNIDNVLYEDFDTWFVSNEKKWVVEYHHEKAFGYWVL